MKHILCILFTCSILNLFAQSITINDIDLQLLKGNYIDAIAVADKFIAENKTNNEVLYRKTIALRHCFKYQEALVNINSIIKTEANNKHYLIELGRLQILNGQKDLAQKTFEFVFYTMDSTDVTNAILLAKIYDKNKQWSKSDSIYSTLSKLDTTNIYFRYKQAVALTKLKKGKDAIPLLQNNLKINSEDIKSRFLLFKIYRALEKIDIALIHMDTIKIIDSLNPEWYYECGLLHTTRSHFYQALTQFEKAIEMGKKDPETISYTGTCLYRIKEYKKALPFLLVNGDMEADANKLYQIGDSYMHLEVYDTAYLYLNKAYETSMPNPFFINQIIDGIARIDLQNKKYTKAIENYKIAIQLARNTKYSYHFRQDCNRIIAEIYETKLKQPETALEIYKTELANTSSTNARLIRFYKQKIEKLNEQLFFEGKN